MAPWFQLTTEYINYVFRLEHRSSLIRLNSLTKNSLIALIMAMTPLSVFSQSRPSILLEDLDEGSLALKCLCTPGVRNKSRSKGLELSYNVIGGGEITAPEFKFRGINPRYDKFRKLRIKASYPIIRTPSFNMVASYDFHSEQYEFNSVDNDFENILGQINNLNFKSSALGLTFSYSPNTINYIGLRLSTRYSGDYAGWLVTDSRYAINSAALAFGVKKDEDNEWGIGLAISNNFRSAGLRMLPFVFWNKNLNSKFGIEATFPSKFYMRYNFNEKTILLGGVNYNGESYSFDQQSVSRKLSFNHSEMQFQLKLERELIPWLWLDSSIGYQFNFDTNFELQMDRRDLLTISPEDSFYFKIGIFISPPDEFR